MSTWLMRLRAVLPIDRFVVAYLLLTMVAVAVIVGVVDDPKTVCAVVAVLVLRDLLFGVSAAMTWRRREWIGASIARLLGASLAARVRRRA